MSLHHPALKLAADLGASIVGLFALLTSVLQVVTPIAGGLTTLMACAWWVKRWRDHFKGKREEAADVDV